MVFLSVARSEVIVCALVRPCLQMKVCLVLKSDVEVWPTRSELTSRMTAWQVSVLQALLGTMRECDNQFKRMKEIGLPNSKVLPGVIAKHSICDCRLVVVHLKGGRPPPMKLYSF